MRTQHTEGTWKIETVNRPDYIGGLGLIIGCDTKLKSTLICDLHSKHRQRGEIVEVNSEKLANARLIAAAPELLEALKEAQKLLRPLVMKMKIKDHFHEHNILANVISKAIDKAEGTD